MQARTKALLVVLIVFLAGLGYLGVRIARQGFSAREKPSRLEEFLARHARKIATPAFLIYAKCELLLGRDDFRLSTEAREVIRFIYEKAHGIESLAKERLSILGEVA